MNLQQMLLERANSPYSQLLATTTLTKLVSRTAQVLSLQQRIDISKSHNKFEQIPKFRDEKTANVSQSCFAASCNV